MRRVVVIVVLFVTAAIVAGGCSASGLAFKADDRVDIVSPHDRADVRLPVTIRWTSRIPRRAGGGPYYAVFVDREPIQPGQSLRALADDACNATRGCPDIEYLRQRYVFVTARTAVAIDSLPATSGQRTRADDRHEATIVLLDANGRRIGETSYSVEFNVKEA